MERRPAVFIAQDSLFLAMFQYLKVVDVILSDVPEVLVRLEAGDDICEVSRVRWRLSWASG